MDKELVNEIIDCLPQDRTLFHYYRDRYAVYLLKRVVEQKQIESVSEIKKTPFAKYLAKPVVNSFLATLGQNELNAEILQQCWPYPIEQHTETYRLSLGCWGDHHGYEWQQTTRRGSNLVLQLNFTTKHDSDFKAWTGIDEEQSFNYFGHPVSKKCDNTLAWSRVDVDFESGAVLIEEIQTDWIRRVDRATKLVLRRKQHGQKVRLFDFECHSNGLLSYDKQVLDSHRKLWAEAMLLATIWFIHRELGITDIYYHTAKTGAVLKNIDSCRPPRSLYTELPKKFCFEETTEEPPFLRHCKKVRRRLKKVKQPTWFKLAV